MRRLVTQNHIETLQTSYGAPSEAIIPLIEQYKVLSFNGGGASPGQLNKDFLWMTRMLFGNDPAPGSLVWLFKTYKAKRLAMLGTLENAVEVVRMDHLGPGLGSCHPLRRRATRQLLDPG